MKILKATPVGPVTRGSRATPEDAVPPSIVIGGLLVFTWSDLFYEPCVPARGSTCQSHDIFAAPFDSKPAGKEKGKAATPMRRPHYPSPQAPIIHNIWARVKRIPTKYGKRAMLRGERVFGICERAFALEDAAPTPCQIVARRASGQGREAPGGLGLDGESRAAIWQGGGAVSAPADTLRA